MESKVLLSVFLLICVAVCHGESNPEHPQGDTTSEDDLKNVCTGECPEFELLCSTPEYDIRRYKSALWVSTTTLHLSLSQATARGRKRLHDYFKGLNDKRLTMPYTAPMVTQTREPSEIESPVREITVSMPLPKKVAKNPPNPRDPSVVIDLVPETIMYVKKFAGRSPSVGFIADLEARNLFKTLKTKKEPFYGNDGYYYVAQYGSPGSSDRNMHNEIWVFAMNERSYKYLEFNDQTADGRVLPKCLRGVETMVWEKMDQSDIPLLTRKQCSTTYCQASNNCPKAETEKVEGIDDMSIRLKIFKGGSRSFVYTPPTCHYDTASHASLGPLVESLKASDISSSEINLMVTVVMEKREELDGKNSCQKFFKVKFVAGGAKGSRSREDVEMKEEAGLQMPKTVEALHQGGDSVSGVYSKCFGGNAYYEPTTITSTAKLLMERLKDKKKCFLGDHISVVEYHPQYRLFDRHNEIHLDADPDCSDQEGRPEFTFNLPLSKDYSRTDMRPSLGDQCDTHHQCPNTTAIMRLENNLEMFQYAPGSWFLSKSPTKSCSIREAFNKALNPLLSYLNGKNEGNSKIDMIIPLYGKVNAFAQPGSCETVTTVSTMVPGKFANNPPKPIEDTVSFQRLEAEKRFIRSLYKGKVGSGEVKRLLIGLIVDVGNLKPFGLEYNPQNMWLATYSDAGAGEELLEVVIEVRKAPKDGQDVIMSEETGDERKEDASDGKVALPKPEGCSESVCPTVYVTKNHSNFMELLLPSRRSVCHLTKLCGDPRTSGRQLIRPILGYFNGDNSANKKIKNFAVPLFKVRLYSAEEEEKGISPCEREYQACVRLPDEYKDIPEPNNKELSIFTTSKGLHGYGMAVRGHVSETVASEATSTLMQTLDKENVPYNKASENCRSIQE
ncbi:uncharacterized protein LOC144877817 [Branchiostoma floridae x Branchiostoma japonicum]